MSIVIIGGHDRMVRQYKDICKQHNCKAKVFTQMPSNFKDKLGTPDLLVLFTNTVSHKMINSALQVAEKSAATVVRSHTSSSCALKSILNEHCNVTCPLQNRCDVAQECMNSNKNKRKTN